MNKTSIFWSTIAIMLSFSIWAGEEDFEEVYVNDQEQVDISEINLSRAWLRLDYPGPISGYCGIKLESSVAIDTILQAFRFNKTPSEKSEKSVIFQFKRWQYVDWLIMEASNKASIKDTLSGLKATLSVSAVLCPKTDRLFRN